MTRTTAYGLVAIAVAAGCMTSKAPVLAQSMPSPAEIEKAEEMQAQINEVFQTYDRDGDGRLDRSEFTTMLKADNPGKEEAIDQAGPMFFAQFDADGDGYVTKVEFALVEGRAPGDCVDC